VSAVDGERLPAYVMIQDEDSRDKYGRRFMEVQESSTSHIDLGTEATEMAYRMLTDLSEPEFSHSIKIQLTPEIDIHDIIGFAPNEKLYTERQYLAVSSVSHTFGGNASTSIDVRGKPSLGSRRWLSIESRLANNPANTPMQAQNAMQKTQRANPMQSIVENTSWMSGGKFAQVRNNGFTTWTNGRRNPPTSWNMQPGTDWDNDEIKATTTSLTGNLSISMHTSRRIESDLIPLDGDSNVPYCLEVRWQRILLSSPAARPNITVKWIAGDGTTVLSSSGPFADLGPEAEWVTQRYQGILPDNGSTSDARYARINVGKDLAGAAEEVIFDSISIYRNAPAFRSYYTAVGNAWSASTIRAESTAPPAAIDVLNITFSDVASSGAFDFGDSIIKDQAGSGSDDGTYFLVPSDGYYSIDGSFYVRFTTADTNIRQLTIGVQARVGADYNISGRQNSPGTVVGASSQLYEISFSGAAYDSYIPLRISSSNLFLSKGDKLSFTVSALNEKVSVVSVSLSLLDSGPLGDKSFMSVKFAEND